HIPGPSLPQGCCNDGGFQLRWWLDLFQGVQPAQRVGDSGDQRGATLARVHVLVEGAPLFSLQQTVKVVAQARFGLFASPGHNKLRPCSENTQYFMPGALPSVAESAPARSGPG